MPRIGSAEEVLKQVEPRRQSESEQRRRRAIADLVGGNTAVRYPDRDERFLFDSIADADREIGLREARKLDRILAEAAAKDREQP